MKRETYKSAFDKFRLRFGAGKCGYCGKPLKGRRIYWCSDECVEAVSILSKDWKTLRDKVLKRDNWTCQKCGLKGDDETNMVDGRTVLQVDHIIPVEIAPARQWDENNLQTLCENCHKAKTKQDMKKIVLHRRREKRKESMVKSVNITDALALQTKLVRKK